MQRLHIRRATPSDHGELSELQRRASLASDRYRKQLEEHPEVMHLQIDAVRRGDVLVAEVGSTIAGFAVVLENGGRAELDDLFVEPALWRKGFGSALVEAAVHQARRRGLSLVTVVSSPEAKAFYERCGFGAEEQVETQFGPAVRMSR